MLAQPKKFIAAVLALLLILIVSALCYTAFHVHKSKHLASKPAKPLAQSLAEQTSPLYDRYITGDIHQARQSLLDAVALLEKADASKRIDKNPQAQYLWLAFA